MRELTGHKVSGVNDRLIVTAVDSPGTGGASHNYSIGLTGEEEGVVTWRITLPFQTGPIREVGVNGITHEALLAVLIDRLEGFQRGKFACDANERALRGLIAARDALLDRTRERAARGVEGTHQV